MKYGDATHMVCGDIGITKWTLTGTQPNGTKVEVLGCDFYTFKNSKVVERDSYWKIVDKA